MIIFSPPSIVPLGGCSGFNLTDNTDYNQQGTGFTTFGFGLFQSGVRMINITLPNGSNTTYATQGFSAGISITGFNNSYNTNINGNGSSFVFSELQQGAYSIDIVSIPYYPNQPSVFPASTFQIGDLAVSSLIGGRYVIYQCQVNNPTSLISDTSQWLPLRVTSNFKLVYASNIQGTPFGFPVSYINTNNTYSQDCYSNSLSCILNNLNSGLCCGCCDDIFKNRNSISVIRATFLTMELQLLQQNSFGYNLLNVQGGNINANLSYINQIARQIQQNYVQPVISNDSLNEKFCEYSKVLDKLCQCAELEKPCVPCDATDVIDNSSNTISQQDIAAMNEILFLNINPVKLFNQETLYGKKLCCVDRKKFLTFFIVNVIYQSGVSITNRNLNCIIDTINDSSDLYNSNNLALINSNNTQFINNTGDTLVFNS